MKKFIIQGLNSKQELEGIYTVSGSKNSGLPSIAMSLLFKKITLQNIPEIEDIFRIIEIVEKLGVKIDKEKNTLIIDTNKIKNSEIDKQLGESIRSSIILTGLILARMGKVSFYFPGGCSIGKRPIDLFLISFKKMGAKISGKGDKIQIIGKNLVGTEIVLPIQSVTVTETIMMTAILAKGETIIKNAAMEPEIKYLANYLNLVGANIKGAGTSIIKIKGRNGKLLNAKKISYINMADRLEAGSIAILAVLCGKNIIIRHFVKNHLEVFLEVFNQIGVKYNFIKKNMLQIKKQNLKNLKSVNIKTHEYPGFPTDLQPQMGALFTQTKGKSKIFETIFESRLSYLNGLVKMGAKIERWNIYQCVIFGPKKLKGTRLISPDLRAGFTYIIVGILAKGKTTIENSYVVKRGYENVLKKLKNIGVDIEEK